MRSRPVFVKPFLIACNTRNPKFSGNAVACLQRLIVANALPRDALCDVLEALREASSLALDIQLKVLQALPSLLQNYADHLTGPLLISAFQVCFLLHNSKTAVVINLAAAALKQLITSTYEKAIASGSANAVNGTASEVSVGDATTTIHGSRLDAYRVFDDICLITDGHKPKYIQGASLAQGFGLDLIETVLSDLIEGLRKWPEQLHLIRIRLMPLLVRVLSEKNAFGTTVRCTRLSAIIIRSLLVELGEDCEILLGLLNHTLDTDSTPTWKRVLTLEMFRSLHADVSLMRLIYSQFDCEENRRNVIRDHLGILVRLASEKPSIIGLGAQSSVPSMIVDDSDQVASQAGGVVGSIGVSTTANDLNTSGISNKWSVLKTPLMEQLDKPDPSPLPISYLYKLVLDCLTGFEEGIARYLLPFSVPKEKRNRRKQKKVTENIKADSTDGERPIEEELPGSKRSKTLVNPLSLDDHPQKTEIEISAQMIEQCWPALLAASSTFFNAALDSENFHALLRAFQKFTQISGLLELVTPRDAFLTTLGKHALPASKGLKPPSARNEESPSTSTDASREPSPVPTTPKLRPPIKRQHTLDIAISRLESRHLLCLRALLNLGIALGPSLRASWTIVLETLQQVDLLMTSAKRTQQRPQSREGEGKALEFEQTEDLGVEITAAETAASRLFEGSKDYEDETFVEFLIHLCGLLNEQLASSNHATPNNDALSPASSTTRKHQKLRSISGPSIESSADQHDSVFVLGKLRTIIRANVQRLTHVDSRQSGWDLLRWNLMESLTSNKNDSKLRLGAGMALNDMITLTAIYDEGESDDAFSRIRARSLHTLLQEVESLHQAVNNTKLTIQCDIEIHRLALEALNAILGRCGDSLTQGWTDVLTTISSAFMSDAKSRRDQVQTSQPRAPVLIRTAFSSIELICSDFLSAVPLSTLLQLLQTLYHFAAQSYDLNISLTVSSFYQSMSEHILRNNGPLDLQMIGSTERKNPQTTIAGHHELPAPQLWLSLLQSLVYLTSDSRLEARHSIIHTIFRILESQSDHLSASDVPKLYDLVLQPLLDANQRKYEEASSSDQSSVTEWNRTVILLIDGLTKQVAQWIDSLQPVAILLDIAHKAQENFEELLQRKSLDVTKAIFSGLSRIFSEIEFESKPEQLLQAGWRVWCSYNPVVQCHIDEEVSDNNEVLLAHLFCLGQLLRLSGSNLSSDKASDVLSQLYTTVTGATAPTYSNDVDSLTPVQKGVIESIKLLPITSGDFDLHLLRLLEQLVVLAYLSRDEDKESQASYVALSKSAMAVVESIIASRIDQKKLASDSELPAIALSAMNVPLHLKYKLQKVGREPSTWRKATSTGIQCLQKTAPVVSKSSDAGRTFWIQVIEMTRGIISADTTLCSVPENLIADETFDIDSFNTIRPLMTSSLDSEELADALRTQYVSSLFENSIIHESHPDDLALPGKPLLSGLKSDHFGRVKFLPPSPRSRLSYLLIDELFSLSSISDQHQPKRLAKAAAPYLILRCGLTLKAYIYDNPLRGLMPQPRSQKKELWYVLDKLFSLDSDPDALPGVNAGDGHKGHLRLLYPLLLRALKAAWRDEETSGRIRNVLGAVGSEWAI